MPSKSKSRGRKYNFKGEKCVNVIKKHVNCGPDSEFLESKFQCSFPKETLHATSEPLQHEFIEFFVDTKAVTKPDFEDIFESEDGMLFEGLSEPVAPIESESDGEDEDSDSDTNEVSDPGPPLTQKNNEDSLADKRTRIHEAPTLIQALEALKDLRKLLHPPRTNGPGHIDPEIDLFVRTQMEGMQTTLNFFTHASVKSDVDFFCLTSPYSYLKSKLSRIKQKDR